jgi:hypothetical protein
MHEAAVLSVVFSHRVRLRLLAGAAGALLLETGAVCATTAADGRRARREAGMGALSQLLDESIAGGAADSEAEGEEAARAAAAASAEAAAELLPLADLACDARLRR